MLRTALNAGFGIVRINAIQYFANVPRKAWEFYIGGYQPAQKWLKDRKGRTLSFDETLHFKQILAIQSETLRITLTQKAHRIVLFVFF